MSYWLIIVTKCLVINRRATRCWRLFGTFLHSATTLTLSSHVTFRFCWPSMSINKYSTFRHIFIKCTFSSCRKHRKRRPWSSQSSTWRSQSSTGVGYLWLYILDWGKGPTQACLNLTWSVCCFQWLEKNWSGDALLLWFLLWFVISFDRCLSLIVLRTNKYLYLSSPENLLICCQIVSFTPSLGRSLESQGIKVGY